MGAFSNAAEALVLNALLRNTGSLPTNVYVGLFTTMPGEDGTGGVECSYTGYARQQVAFDAPVAGDPTTVANTAEEDFGDPDADLSIVGFGIWDAATNGTLLVLQAFDDPVTVQAAIVEAVKFAPGALTVSLD